MVDGSKVCLSANALNVASTKQAETMGFSGMITIGKGAAVLGEKHYSKEKGKKGAGVVMVYRGVFVQPYMPIKLPLPRKAHIKEMAVCLEAANITLPSSLYADPMLPLVATLAIFKAILDSQSVALKDKE